MNIMIGFSHSVTILIGFDLLEIRFMAIQIYYVRVHLVVTLGMYDVLLYYSMGAKHQP